MNEELTPLEKGIRSFQRSALPEEWKDETLHALTGSEETSLDPAANCFGLTNRILFSGIAASWILICLLHFATPQATNSEKLAERFGIPVESLPLLAARIGLGSESD